MEASHSARKGVTVKIIEEMADVLLMIEQVIYLAEIDMCDIEDCINLPRNVRSWQWRQATQQGRGSR